MSVSTYINRASIAGSIAGAILTYVLIAYEAFILGYGWLAVIPGPILAPLVHMGFIGFWPATIAAITLAIACLIAQHYFNKALIRWTECRIYVSLQQELDSLLK